LEPEISDDQPGRDVIIMFAVFFEGGLAPLSLVLGWWLGHAPLALFAWDVRPALWGALVSVPLVALFIAILRWPIGPLRKIASFTVDEFVPMLAGSTWSDIALVALSAGVGEEMLFRGVIQCALQGWLGTGPGLTFSSVLFGLLHPISIPYIVVMVVLGLCLGGEFVLTANLMSVIVTHTLFDFALMAYLLKIQYHGEPSSPIPPVDSGANVDDYDES
jgi:membrane protease YdiL (CAAX protease family)